MNKTINHIAILLLIIIVAGCKKEQFDHGPIDFKYADDIAGTYTGTKDVSGNSSSAGMPDSLKIKTITVEVEDHRTDKICSFYIDYFNKEFNVKPNGEFVNSYSVTGGSSTTGHTFHGYFKGDTLYYKEEVEYYHYNAHFTQVILKLVKQ